jgi:hypothetical protein
MLSVAASASLCAQHSIEGVVMEESANGEFTPLELVHVVSIDGQSGTYTDSTGYFKLNLPTREDESYHQDVIVVTYIGFAPDTIIVNEQHYLSIVLKDNAVLDEVEIVYRKRTTEVSFLDPRLVQNISQGELFKAACCNLSESFETNASVDVNFTDAITGAKELQMLGLAGKYTMISREFMPGIRGIAVPYGLLYTPGSWIQSMQVTKGAGSVVNGYESIAGQINVEWKKPEGDERLAVNAYINEALRNELNASASIDVSPKLQTAILGHFSYHPKAFDRNNDGFADQPTGSLYVISNRWKYNSGKSIRAQIGVTYTNDDKVGGQIGYTEENPNGLYGVLRKTERIDVWGKVGFVFPVKRYQSLGLQWSYSNHDQDLLFGKRRYQGIQKTGYANLIYQSIIGTTDHKFKAGLSYLFDGYKQIIEEIPVDRNENGVGAFFEYTYTYLEKFTAVGGVRVDYNSQFDAFFTPRVHLRYTVSNSTVIRASFGRGYRSANVIAENLSILASSRKVITPDTSLNSMLESAWNYGASIHYQFNIDYRPGTISADFFRTQFTDQIVVDYEQSPQQAWFYTLGGGQSFSNSFQVEASYELMKRLDLKLAYRRTDAKTEFQSGLKANPLIAQDRAFANLAYKTRQKSRGHWMFDGTLQFVGSQRIPSTASNPEGLKRPDYSPSYVMFSTQITRNFNVGRSGTKTLLSVYIGAENLFDYKQNDPIISANDPFGPYFDSGLIWGPIFGRNIYAGIRYTLDKKDK